MPGVTTPGRLWASRPQIQRPEGSRRFVDAVIGDLATERLSLKAWARFLGRSIERSIEQARMHSAVAAEVTALHAVAAAGSWRWALWSWLLCITHLGLLGERASLGSANRLTIARGLLPAVAPDSRWTSILALATDLADGLLARRGEESAFGGFADPIADGVFWSTFALRWERNHWLRWAPLAVFGVAAGAIAVSYFARGRTIDYPRLIAVRYLSVGMQVALTLRALQTRRA